MLICSVPSMEGALELSLGLLFPILVVDFGFELPGLASSMERLSSGFEVSAWSFYSVENAL